MVIKILIVARHPVGGIRTYLKYTYRHLDQDKYEITIMTVKSTEGAYLKSDLKPFKLNLIEIDNVHPEFNLARAIRRLLAKKQIDIIHSQGFTAGVITGLGNWFFKVPHVITPHGLFEMDQFGRKFRYVKKWIAGRILGRADVIQSVSYDAESNLLEFYPFLAEKRTKLKVIQNGIDIDLFQSNSNNQDIREMRCELRLEHETSLFGYLGRFMPEKGFEYLINAVEILSMDRSYAGKFKVLAVNDGAFIREYRSIIRSKGLSGYFVFLGFVPDVSKILNGLDALVVPSISEAFGLIAAEAFLAGCPVIATDCRGLREVVRDTPALIAHSRDVESLVEALKTFMDKSKDVKNEAIRFIPLARERFDSKKTAAQLDSLFDELMAKRKRSMHSYAASGQTQ